jgi:hypothetical protein
MKTKYWSVSSLILEGGPRRPELLPKPMSSDALKLRKDKLDAAQRELELRRTRLETASGANAIQAVKTQNRNRRKEPKRVPSGLDWHVTNNDK